MAAAAQQREATRRSAACRRCGCLLHRLPETGAAVVCSRCATVNSRDPGPLGQEDEVAPAFSRMNRNLGAFAFLLGAAFVVFGLIAAAWWLIAVGAALIAGAVLVSCFRPRWFQTP